jgi:hypothetical protein
MRYYHNKQTGKVEPVTPEWEAENNRRPAPYLTEGVEYANLRAMDGTDISSRKKRREYMARHGVTDASDFKETGPKLEGERVALHFTGTKPNPNLKTAIITAVNRHWRR